MPLTTTSTSIGYTYEEPDGWGFPGSDWTNPDPANSDYWRSLYWAILERQEAVRTVGTSTDNLVKGTDSPFNLHTIQTPTLVRKSVLDLIPRFLDASQLSAKMEEYNAETWEYENVPDHVNDWLDSYFSTRDFLNSYTAFRDYPTAGATRENCRAFLTDCRDILNRLTLAPYRVEPLVLSDERSGVADEFEYGWSRGAAIASAKAAVAEWMEIPSSGYGHTVHALTNYGIIHVNGEGEDWECVAARQNESFTVIDPNQPPLSILGHTMSPSLSALVYSTKCRARVFALPVVESDYTYYSPNFELGYSIKSVLPTTSWNETSEYPEAVDDATKCKGATTTIFYIADFAPCFAFSGIN